MIHPPPAAARGPIPPTTAPAPRGGFLLATCQGGAEAALVARQQLVLPAISRAAWRRGVVTFRLGDVDPSDDFWPDLVFARAVIRSVGQVTGATDADRARAAGELVAHRAWDAIHVWHRDPKLATESDPAAMRSALLEAFGLRKDLPTVARPGDLVLDCLVDSETRAWIGWHRARLPASLHAGGFHPQSLPPDKVSRAWLKLDEALASFGLVLAPGERACELGCAPGGACQRLLEAGLHVVGIDPAAVDPRVAAQPRFAQWRMRARDVKLRGFRGFDWIVADMNIDPRSTLAAIERVVTADGVRPRGIIATLKLPDWSRAAELPGWLERFRGWGFRTAARQLSTGGREVCVVALRDTAGRPRTAG